MSQFALKLKEYRERSGITQSQLSRLVDVNPSYISRVEAGDRQPPRRDIVLKIGEALKLNYDERNMLLVAAGYAPISVEDTMQLHPTMKLLADIIGDKQIPEDQKELIESLLRQIHRHWRQ